MLFIAAIYDYMQPSLPLVEDWIRGIWLSFSTRKTCVSCIPITMFHSFSLRVQGPQIWNDIPLSLRNSLTVSSYKHKLRDYFQSL